jgi:hypothetical protein
MTHGNSCPHLCSQCSLSPGSKRIRKVRLRGRKLYCGSAVVRDVTEPLVMQTRATLPRARR